MDTIATLIDELRAFDMIAKFLRIMAKAGVTIEHIKLLINNRVARANLVTYLQAGCPKLAKAVVAVKAIVYNFLKPIGQTEVLRRTAEFNPQAFFKTGDGLYIWDGFKDLVLKSVEPVSEIPALTLGKFQLVENACDREIRSELPEGHLFHDPSLLCALIAGLIQQQSNGKAGTLLNNGYANLFYLEVNGKVVVVAVNSRADDQRWHVGARQLADHRWHAGNQVLSATAA
jgi:hypothetical protein